MKWLFALALFFVSAVDSWAQGTGGSFPTPGGQYVDGVAGLVPCGNIINGQPGMCPPGLANALPVTVVGGGSAAPVTAPSNPVAVTIASTGVPQLVIAQNASRKACILQNGGTHPMSFSLLASGASPLKAQPGDSFYCTGTSLVTSGDDIYVSGTAGDVLNGYWQ